MKIKLTPARLESAINLVAAGWTLKDIAAEFDCSASWLSTKLNRVRKEDYQAAKLYAKETGNKRKRKLAKLKAIPCTPATQLTSRWYFDTSAPVEEITQPLYTYLSF